MIKDTYLHKSNIKRECIVLVYVYNCINSWDLIISNGNRLGLKLQSPLALDRLMTLEQLQQFSNAQPSHFLSLIPQPNIDRPFLQFLLANHTDIVVSFLLCVEDLLVEGISTAVDGDRVALEQEGVVDLFGEVVCVVSDGNQL